MNKKLICHAVKLVICAGKEPKHDKDMSDTGVIKDGAILIDDDEIVAVGMTEQLKQQCSEIDCEIINTTGKAVMPGFVDPYTYFVFGSYRADEFFWHLKGDNYMPIMERGDGINTPVSRTRAVSLEELVEMGRDRLDRMSELGVTTVERKNDYGLDKETELRQPRAMKELSSIHCMDVVPTFMGPYSALPEYEGCGYDFIDFLLHEVMSVVKEENLAEFAGISTEKSIFSVGDSRRYVTEVKKTGFKLRIHAGETTQLGGAELVAEVDTASTEHFLQDSDKGTADIAKAGVTRNALPCTAFCSKGPYVKARKTIDEGTAVAFSSDLDPGNYFTNSTPLMIALACIYAGLLIKEAITTPTINGTVAVDRVDQVGSVGPGKQADVILLRYPSIHYLPYHTATNLVGTAIKNGETIHRR